MAASRPQSSFGVHSCSVEQSVHGKRGRETYGAFPPCSSLQVGFAPGWGHTGCHRHCSQPLPLPPCRYIERKAFLERVDHRQFEIERDIRLSRMKP